MLPISATPLPHRGKSLWPFAALYASAQPPQNPPKTRMNSAILNSHVLLRLYKYGTRMLHNLAVYISKLAYSATPLPREEAGDIKRKGPRHHVATLPPDGCFVAYNVIQLRSCRPQNKPLAFKKK